MSKIEDAVCKKIQTRAAFGLGKYGVSLETAGLSRRELLVHLQEELMDSANYIETLLQQEDLLLEAAPLLSK